MEFDAPLLLVIVIVFEEDDEDATMARRCRRSGDPNVVVVVVVVVVMGGSKRRRVEEESRRRGESANALAFHTTWMSNALPVRMRRCGGENRTRSRSRRSAWSIVVKGDGDAIGGDGVCRFFFILRAVLCTERSGRPHEDRESD